MPTLVEFDGMAIKMYHRPHEHNVAHVHVYYEDKSCSVSIRTFDVIEGKLPPNKMVRINEWLKVNKNQLNKIWKTGKMHKLAPLPPK